MWHYVIIQFLGGENFGLAYLRSNINDVEQKMAMLMGVISFVHVCSFAMAFFGIV